MVIKLKGMGYEERLKVLGLINLENRRKREDVTKLYNKKEFQKGRTGYKK